VFTQAVIKGCPSWKTVSSKLESLPRFRDTTRRNRDGQSIVFDLDAMGKAVREVSDALNVPLQKTGGALFRDGKRRSEKRRRANQFLKTVGEFPSQQFRASSLEQVLSGALNAFDLGLATRIGLRPNSSRRSILASSVPNNWPRIRDRRALGRGNWAFR